MATTVCIEMSDDGQYSVGIEPDGADSGMTEGDPAEMEQDKSYMTPAKDIDDALAMAREMLSADERSPEQAMMDGYNKGGNKMSMSKVTPSAVFGE